MPIDGDRGDLERSAIPIHDISERLRRSGADNIILLIDACRSYGGRRDGLGIGQERQQGVITLFSCSPEESSYEIQELQHGAFTHVLIESLRLQGEGNCATVERLYQRLRYYVPQLTREYKRVVQTPYGVIEPPSKNHLILLPQQATLTDVMALKNDALAAEVKRQSKAARQLWIRVLMVSPGDPAAIEGIERLSRGGGAPPASSPGSLPEHPESKPTTAQVTPRAATPPSPSPSSHSKGDDSIAPKKSAPQAKQSPVPDTPAEKTSNNTRKPQKSTSPARRSIFPSSSRKKTPDSLGKRISRRRAIQILGFTGGGIGAVLLGRGILKLNDWKLPPLEPPSTSGEMAEFNVATVNIQDKKITVERKQAEFRTEKLGDGANLELMVIPGGTFKMGSSDGQVYDREIPQHEVSIQSFLMGKYSVTQAQWKAVAALPKVEQELNHAPSYFKGSNRPVEQVSWDEAVEFCQRLSQKTGREYCLPSEAEWEYACRAGTTTPFHFGETLTSDLANYRATFPYGSGPKGKYREQTTNVGSFPENAFGLCDMHGNVWEWCLDHWHENYAGAPIDGSAWLSSDNQAARLLRGGSWIAYPSVCRSANRFRGARTFGVNDIGFRVVCASSWTL